MKSKTHKRAHILYCAEASSGGIAEYVKFHTLALISTGLEVTLLCREDYPYRDLKGVTVLPQLPSRKREKSTIARVFHYISDSRAISKKIFEKVSGGGFEYVLLDCFREYLSPFWVGPFIKAHRQGARFGVVAHDPVRDFVVGPIWWHQFSIRKAYAFIDDVYVHDDSRIDFGGEKPDKISVHEVPHGPFNLPEARRSRSQMRKGLGFNDNDLVFLAFGQIRDGKNLDLFLQTMPTLPEQVKLLVAGRGDSGSQKSPQFYRQEAESLGLETRCHWHIQYVHENEITELFDASDVVLLTYSKAFVSASGVLNIAVARNRPVLASGGEGPLKKAVCQYPIGVWIDEPNIKSIQSAVDSFTTKREEFEFENYLVDHSWTRNAQTVKEAIVSRLNEN